MQVCPSMQSKQEFCGSNSIRISISYPKSVMSFKLELKSGATGKCICNASPDLPVYSATWIWVLSSVFKRGRGTVTSNLHYSQTVHAEHISPMKSRYQRFYRTECITSSERTWPLVQLSMQHTISCPQSFERVVADAAGSDTVSVQKRLQNALLFGTDKYTSWLALLSLRVPYYAR